MFSCDYIISRTTIQVKTHAQMVFKNISTRKEQGTDCFDISAGSETSIKKPTLEDTDALSEATANSSDSDLSPLTQFHHDMGHTPRLKTAASILITLSTSDPIEDSEKSGIDPENPTLVATV